MNSFRVAVPYRCPAWRMAHARGSWMGHGFGLDEGVEFLGGEEAKLGGGFFEARVFVVGGFGDFGSIVVADFGGEGGDEHEGIVDVVVDGLAIDLDPEDAVIDETIHGVSEKLDGMEKVEDHDGFEDVELEIALRAGHADGGVVAHNLNGDHSYGFALRGVYFAGHDGGAGLIFGEGEFAETAAGAGSEPANVVGDFHQGG